MLPIHSILPELLQACNNNTVVLLEAPPGAGKTTVVPLALLNEEWLGGNTVLMIEPRRIAAKAAARRLAHLLNEDVGQRVGYRMRNETLVGPRTSLEVITEGVLTRRLARDPELQNVGMVIFDEFHERSIHADTGFALTLLTQTLARPTLRILIMSATLDAPSLQRVVPHATIVRSSGRSFPINTTYLRSTSDKPLDALMTLAIRDAVRDGEGDILCFLPGRREIRQTQNRVLADNTITENTDVHILHGELRAEDQDLVLRAARQRRRVILSTAIAETSITIDGVRTVIDGGLSREPRYDPRSGMAHLTTVRVSKDSADQRRGRAGRTAPGECIRLWTVAQHEQLAEKRTPEIVVSDLVPMVLDVAAYGIMVEDCEWIDAPPAGTLAQARELLRELGALDSHSRITDHGRKLASIGAHPRVAHMLVRGEELGIPRSASGALASLIGERDVLSGVRMADIHMRLDALAGTYSGGATDNEALRNAKQRMAQFGGTIGPNNNEHAALLLALAYPDRIARRKADGRFLLRNGRSARINGDDPLARCEWLAVSELDGSGAEPRVAIAAEINTETIESLFGSEIHVRAEGGWNAKEQRIVARTARMLGAIVVGYTTGTPMSSEELAEVFARFLAERALRDLTWTDEARQLVHRVRFVHANGEAHVPAWTDDDLAGTAHQWLAPYLLGKKTLEEVAKINVVEALISSLPQSVFRRIATLAPEFYTPPKGREVRIDYSVAERPTASVRIQFMFGVKRQPTVAAGNVPLTIELLSPAGRPIQVTRDLAGFWAGSYALVRKEMKGRYPKHDWPESP